MFTCFAGNPGTGNAIPSVHVSFSPKIDCGVFVFVTPHSFFARSFENVRNPLEKKKTLPNATARCSDFDIGGGFAHTRALFLYYFNTRSLILEIKNPSLTTDSLGAVVPPRFKNEINLILFPTIVLCTQTVIVLHRINCKRIVCVDPHHPLPLRLLFVVLFRADSFFFFAFFVPIHTFEIIFENIIKPTQVRVL